MKNFCDRENGSLMQLYFLCGRAQDGVRAVSKGIKSWLKNVRKRCWSHNESIKGKKDFDGSGSTIDSAYAARESSV